MVTKKQISIIRSLKQKKYRDKHKLFFVEGDKIVKEVMDSSYQVADIYASPSWKEKNPGQDVIEIGERQLAQISSQITPNGVFALVHMPEPMKLPPLFSGFTLLLDGISDPGNMGTILRIADWFSVECVVCSPNCVDRYNPKVLQSSMGSFVRVQVVYTELASFIKGHNDQAPIYAMVMDGKSIYNNRFEKNSLVVIGNESRGISEEVLNEIDKKIAIPSYGKADSLNAAIAAGIACSEYKRVN